MKKDILQLRDNPIWKEAFAIAEYTYARLNELEENFPDEKWNSVVKFRNGGNDLIFYTAQAIGAESRETMGYDWSNVRKSLFAIETVYIFATKQDMLELDPQFIVRIDTLITKIDIEIENSKKAIKQKEKEELEPWLEKYRIWKEINKTK